MGVNSICKAQGECRLVFVEVAESMGIPIYAREGDFISFFNSPYYSHRRISALDIYHRERRYGSRCLSPVSGKVRLIRPFNPPKSRWFEGSDRDWLILIDHESAPELCVRILHLKPTVDVGDEVQVGDCLGTFLRTGHFNFWTDPHIHVEVRDPKDALRASGCYPMKPVNNTSILTCELGGSLVEALDLRISDVRDDYVLVRLRGGLLRVGNFWGLGCEVKGHLGIIEGGIPHYGYGGVHLESSGGVKEGSSVTVGGIDVGVVERIFESYIIFKCSPIEVSVGDHPMRGLSLYLSLGPEGQLKIVPFERFKPNTPDFPQGEIRIRSKKNN